jgi:hypothetical protein
MITISHTHQDGTLIEGSRKGDGVYEILRGLRSNWRYFPSIRKIGLGQSRDKAAKTWDINQAAEALRNAGHDVAVEIDDTEARSFAEQEADRYARAEDRADRLAGAARNAAGRSNAAYERSRQMGEAIPFGQPMMPDHYSYNRDRNYRERMHNLMGKSIEEAEKADHYAHRADLAENMQASRENVPTTLRRIAKLEAEMRDVERNIAGRQEYVRDDNGDYKLVLVKPGPKRLALLERRKAEHEEQIAYWRGVIAKAEADGVKVWGPSDFTKGDFVRSFGTWAEVLRVNPKSVTVAWGTNFTQLDVITKANSRTAIGTPGWTDTIPYDKIRECKSAEEIAPLLAAQEAKTAG